MNQKLISLLLISCFISNVSLAECNFSTGVTRLEDGSYKYSKECHIKVGEMKQDLEIANKQVEQLNKVIELKDLALSKSNERVALWMDTTYKLEDRLNKIEGLQSKNHFLYFGLGVVTAIGAAYAASKLIR